MIRFKVYWKSIGICLWWINWSGKLFCNLEHYQNNFYTTSIVTSAISIISPDIILALFLVSISPFLFT